MLILFRPCEHQALLGADARYAELIGDYVGQVPTMAVPAMASTR
jgi:hypothetical protein